jgi:hypothetical protein
LLPQTHFRLFFSQTTVASFIQLQEIWTKLATNLGANQAQLRAPTHLDILEIASNFGR